MTQTKHILEIYEPYDYTGPNPMVVAGVSTALDPTGVEYFLLQLAEPVDLADAQLEQILVKPRYNGDKIDRATCSSCTVIISRVMPGHHVNGSGHFEFEQVHHWGVGKITVAPG
ncbi:MAG: hypothetical protein LC646_07025 [Xanthomonadaceae bacterium]|nr:hypothetical protein [Xanthomonadaceae bacterium]